MSKLLKKFVGIDVSKLWFDVAVVKSPDVVQNIHKQFSQNADGFKKMVSWLVEQDVLLNDQTLFCMEYTGIYNTPLVNFLVKQQVQLWVEMPLRIKKSEGLQRGGDDRVSALKIAMYAYRHQDAKQLWKPLVSSIERIKLLIAQRDRIMNAVTQLSVPVQELAECGCIAEAKAMEKIQKSSLRQLQKAKDTIEQSIREIVADDTLIARRVNQVQSIQGIGPVTAVALLAYTKGFTSFDNAKQLACYCGVVPFSKSSGISVRYKPKVSPHANKKLKKLLHLCALSAIKNDKEIKAYFERKVNEGKNKMSVLNAVRNKLIHRVFAVIRDDRFYQQDYARNCA
jgi:transposase